MSSLNNNIPDGFKMTELGLLPEEWETTKLGDLFEIKQGKALSPEHRRGISPRPFLRTANVFWGYLDLTNVDSMDFTDAEVSQLKLMPNDLLVCEGGDIGRTAIWRDESKVCCYQNHLHRLRTTREDVHPLFYMYWMQVAHLLFGLYGGTGNKTTIPNLSQSRLKSFILPLPPLPQQQEIARVLSTIQKAVETQDKIIAAARELKKSLMRHLFTYGPVPVTEADKVLLKETEIGPVPEHWEVVRLGELGEIVTGTTPSTKVAEYYGGSHMFITPGDMHNAKYVSKTKQYLSDKGLAVSRALPSDSILVVCIGSLGLTAMTSVDGCATNQQVNAIIPNHKIDSHYCFYAVTYYSYLLSNLAGGVTIPIVNKSNFLKFIIPLPSMSEQQKITSILSAVDNKIEAEENRKAALQALFKTMLHHLMTGKVRVNKLEAEV